MMDIRRLLPPGTYARLLAAALAWAASGLPAGAAEDVAITVERQSTVSVVAGGALPTIDTRTDDTPAVADQTGLEVDDCAPNPGLSDGRASAAQARAATSIKTQGSDAVDVLLSARSYANGGHIRACNGCIAKTICVGIHGRDTGSSASAEASALVKIDIANPLRRFRYELLVASVTGHGALDVSVMTPGGALLQPRADDPSSYLLTETTRKVWIRAAARSGAKDTGGCCNKDETADGTLSVSLKPAAEIDANFTFEPFIANGKKTFGYPFVVAIGLDGKVTCTGTFVGTDTVITAAHCVYAMRRSIPLGHVDVRFGSLFAHPDKTFQVVAGEYPVDAASGFMFNPESYEDDIGILHFKGTALYQPAALYAGMPSWESVRDTHLKTRIVGFGLNPTDGDGVGIKRFGEVSIDTVQNRRIYFGLQNANTCAGDSGGPLFLPSLDGKSLLLAAVTSGGDDTCSLGVDTRIDAFKSWLATRIH